MPRKTSLKKLLDDVRACQICANHLPNAPRPVVRANAQARVLIVGQAPGTRVHASGIPWDDPSGNRLRDWLAVDKQTFYDEQKFAIVPMGFCYPGKGKSGDLAPRPECAPQWHASILARLPKIELTLLIGQYAQQYYLDDDFASLTERVKSWQHAPDGFIPLPHPSPRNQLWLKRNPWFSDELLPVLAQRVSRLLAS